MSRRSAIILAGVTTALLVALLAAGCGNASRVLKLEASASVDNVKHEATIATHQDVVGNMLMGVVLTHPDGRKELLMTANTGGGSSSYTTDSLPTGEYSYAVYAIPTGPEDARSFPIGSASDSNLVASGTFTVQ
jgi:hypothetical protein